MEHKERFTKWKAMALNEEIAAELSDIQEDDEQIKTRFSSELEFGTAGLRSRIGAGTNRMNIYTVGRATQGMSEYVQKNCGQQKGMVIAYDTRNKSAEFALTTALVFAANGIKTYLFDSAASVPLLSFTIKELNAFGGVAITASHNPKDYNGYKAYASWGGQLLGEECEQVTQFINNVDYEKVLSIDRQQAKDKGLLVLLGEDIRNKYYKRLAGMAKRPENIEKYAHDIHVVYTPLFGTGMQAFEGVIENMPYDYSLVKSQCAADPEFPGLNAPNPEDENAMKKAIELAVSINADIAFGTDPDADRMGAAIPSKNGGYIMISGNQAACVITDYLFRQREKDGQLKSGDYIVKSFVSTRMADDIAKSFGARCITVPTGFKYISDTINNKENAQNFVFGFEESCGFLAGDFIADKDGVMAGMLLLEVLCECKKNGETLYERLFSLYEKYGWHKEKTVYAIFDGLDGMDKVKRIMKNLRENPPKTLGGQKVVLTADYLQAKEYDANGEADIDFPHSDALCFNLENGWLCIRPSGTEPKLRVYCGVYEKTNEASQKLLDALEKDAKALLET